MRTIPLLFTVLFATAITAAENEQATPALNYKKLHLEMDMDKVGKLMGKPNAPAGLLNLKDGQKAWLVDTKADPKVGSIMTIVITESIDNKVNALRIETYVIGTGRM